jgi:hypothetical protein
MIADFVTAFNLSHSHKIIAITMPMLVVNKFMG